MLSFVGDSVQGVIMVSNKLTCMFFQLLRSHENLKKDCVQEGL